MISRSSGEIRFSFKRVSSIQFDNPCQYAFSRSTSLQGPFQKFILKSLDPAYIIAKSALKSMILNDKVFVKIILPLF